MHLDSTVQVSHVQEAHRIFRISTLNAAASGISSATESPAELQPIIKKIEEAIKRRVAIGTKISYPKLHSEMMQRYENGKAIDHVSFFEFFKFFGCWLFSTGYNRNGEERRDGTLRTEEDSGEKKMRDY